MEYSVELKNIYLSYNDRAILKDGSFGLKAGSIAGIVGLSGVGKTSLIRVMNGNIKNDAHVKLKGEVLLFGSKEINKDKPIIATVYQDPDTQIVFPNVLDEITFGMENFCFTKSHMDKNIQKYTKELGIEHLLERNPNNLSGGEKQLVVLTAVLCIQPKILLLDECISQVDEEGKKRAKAVFRSLADKGTTIVMVEHNCVNLDIADEVYRLKNSSIQMVESETIR